jgi:hypothetical protein
MGIGPQLNRRAKKGVSEMSSQSPLTRSLFAIAAALTLSTVAVGAAVGPAQANANTLQVRTYA